MPATVSVIGLGYIGLPTAAFIARAGHRVFGTDIAQRVVDTINRGEIHIEEPGLAELVRSAVEEGVLSAHREPQGADVHIIAVPTPFDEGHAPDLSHVMAAGRSVAPLLKRGDCVILESTSPVGATEQLCALLAEARPDLNLPRPGGEPANVHVAYCPERVLPGRIIAELEGNDRVIGGMTPACADEIAAFYRRFVRGACVITDARSAEMVKLTENAFRDVNIAFANELSIIADRMDLNVWEVIRLANRHPRVNILNPGPGVGGHCIAVDPWFIVHSAPEQSPLIRTARQVNDGKVDHVVERASRLIERTPGPAALLGLAFKANIDDFRESPALKVAAALARRFGERIQIVEPHTEALPREFSDTGARLTGLDEALTSAATLVVLVDHELFAGVPLARRLGKAVYDTRGLWPDQAQAGSEPA